MNYKLEMRIVNSESGMSIAGVSSAPFNVDHLYSSEIFKSLENNGYTLIGLARSHNQANPPARVPTKDAQAPFFLRQFAELLDQGKYVISVTRFQIGDTGSEEIRIILDRNKC
jgi:hypothetical protein